jgi:hypothetical protein
MAVVINEFEVIPETPAEAPAASPPPETPAAPRPSLPAYEMARVAQHETERALRVWAH